MGCEPPCMSSLLLYSVLFGNDEEVSSVYHCAVPAAPAGIALALSLLVAGVDRVQLPVAM